MRGAALAACWRAVPALAPPTTLGRSVSCRQRSCRPWSCRLWSCCQGCPMQQGSTVPLLEFYLASPFLS